MTASAAIQRRCLYSPHPHTGQRGFFTTGITFDANHEMAGKELNFQIELVKLLKIFSFFSGTYCC